MSVTEVTRKSRHAWAIWVFVLGFFAMIVGTMLAVYGPERSGVVVVVAAIVVAIVYTLAAWVFMRSVLQPHVQCDIYLDNDEKNWIRVTASQANGLCTIVLNGEQIAKRQSLNLMFDMDVSLDVPLPNHPATLLIPTPWFLRMKRYLDIDGERVVSA